APSWKWSSPAATRCPARHLPRRTPEGLDRAGGRAESSHRSQQGRREKPRPSLGPLSRRPPKARMKLQLSLAIASNPRTWPILDATVKPDGIELAPTILPPSEMFWRQLRFAVFDASEMSVSSLMMARGGGDERGVGLPIFTTRRFFHNDIMVRRDSKIEKPAHLKGRRV